MLATSVNGLLGHSVLIIGLVASLFGAIALATATVTHDRRLLRSIPNYAWLGALAGLAAALIMLRALLTYDFDLAYVQQVGSRTTPTLYNITALWSALEGSILLWLGTLSGYTAIIMRRYRKRLDDPLVAWALVTMFVVTAFFFLLAFGPADAFATGAAGVTDGPGPNPLLQNHVLVLFHPPILYLGYVGFTVPFAFAIGALATGRVGEGWLMETRRWALLAWGFLTIGIVLGSWWSYEVLGWGGVWAWDPVENASFLPWLTGTAYIHSVLVQERRGMLRVWNISLLVATFALTILGTVLSRSGVIQSVHAFSNGSIGPYLLAFFGLIVVVSLGLIAWRGDRLRAPGAIDSPLSREGAFLANNVIFTVFAFVVLLGTVFPLIVEALQDRQIAVGSPFFDRLTMPIGLVLLFLMAVAPVLPWRKASGELLRERLFVPAWCGALALIVAVVVGADQWASLAAFALGGFAAGAAGRQLVLATRRQGWRGLVGRANGGMIVHLGVILIGVGLAASNGYTRVGEFTMQQGKPVVFAGHTFELEDVRGFATDRSTGVRAEVSIDGGQAYSPAVTRYTMMGTDIPTPSVKTGFSKDIYLTLESVASPDATEARIKVSIKPLILWLWIGGGLMAVGTVLAAFPGKRRRLPTMATSAPVPVDGPESPDRPQDHGDGTDTGNRTGTGSGAPEEPVHV
ncbi:MAG: heme lyase CcmF/NrfE family subunit [Actinobacteria bacterium]|nr:heme lyase CcmF/NrfE family subunit [Actinomycetota bacterium]